MSSTISQYCAYSIDNFIDPDMEKWPEEEASPKAGLYKRFLITVNKNWLGIWIEGKEKLSYKKRGLKATHIISLCLKSHSEPDGFQISAISK